jgi:hypothetical protein
MYQGALVAIRRHLDCSACSFLIASGRPPNGTRVVHHRTEELQLGWIFLAFYRIRSFIIVFTRDCHLSLTRARLTQPTTSHTTTLRFMFISLFYINLAIPSCHHSSCSPEKVQYKFLFHHICHIPCLANLPSFDHPNKTRWQAMSRSSSIRDLQQSPVTATPQLTTSPFTTNQSYDQNVRKKIFPATYFTTTWFIFYISLKKNCSCFFLQQKDHLSEYPRPADGCINSLHFVFSTYDQTSYSERIMFVYGGYLYLPSLSLSTPRTQHTFFP